MRDRAFLFALPLMVVASAAIAYTLVFWTPWFRASSGDWVTKSATPYLKTDEWGTGLPFSKGYATALPGGFGEVGTVDIYPDVTPEVLTKLLQQLLRMENHKLRVLKHLENLCDSRAVECDDLSSNQVKPLIEEALAHQQAAIAEGSLKTSQWSLVVAFAALLAGICGHVIAYLTYRRRLGQLAINSPSVASSPPNPS